MFSQIKILWESNISTLLFSFFLSFLIGFVLSMIPLLESRDKRKKRFKNDRLFEKDRELDKRITKDVKNGGTYRIDFDSDTFRVLLSDDMESHSNKKYR